MWRSCGRPVMVVVVVTVLWCGNGTYRLFMVTRKLVESLWSFGSFVA